MPNEKISRYGDLPLPTRIADMISPGLGSDRGLDISFERRKIAALEKIARQGVQRYQDIRVTQEVARQYSPVQDPHVYELKPEEYSRGLEDAVHRQAEEMHMDSVETRDTITRISFALHTDLQNIDATARDIALGVSDVNRSVQGVEESVRDVGGAVAGVERAVSGVEGAVRGVGEAVYGAVYDVRDAVDFQTRELSHQTHVIAEEAGKIQMAQHGISPAPLPLLKLASGTEISKVELVALSLKNILDEEAKSALFEFLSPEEQSIVEHLLTYNDLGYDPVFEGTLSSQAQAFFRDLRTEMNIPVRPKTLGHLARHGYLDRFVQDEAGIHIREVRTDIFGLNQGMTEAIKMIGGMGTVVNTISWTLSRVEKVLENIHSAIIDQTRNWFAYRKDEKIEREAVPLMQIGEYQDALKALMHAQRMNSMDPRIFFYKGLSYMALQKPDMAQEELEKALKRAEGIGDQEGVLVSEIISKIRGCMARISYQTAKRRLTGSDPEKDAFVKSIQSAIESARIAYENEKNSQTRFDLAQYLCVSGQYEESLKYVSELLWDDPEAVGSVLNEEDFEPMYGQITALKKDIDTEKEKQRLETERLENKKRLETEQREDAERLRLEEERKKRERENLKEQRRKISDRHPENIDAAFEWLEILCDEDRIGEAQSVLGRIISGGPNDETVLARLRANTLFTPLLRYAIETRWVRDHGVMNAAFEWLEVLCTEEKLEEAQRVLDKIIVGAPNDEAVLSRLRKKQLFIPLLRYATEIQWNRNTNNINAAFEWLEVLCGEKKIEEGKRVLDKIIVGNPNDGLILTRLWENPLFVPLLEYAIKIRWERNPNDINAVLGWAEILCKENKPEEAKRIIHPFIIGDEKDSQLGKMLSQNTILSQLQLWFLRETVKVKWEKNPTSVDAVFGWLQILCRENNLTEAQKALNRIIVGGTSDEAVLARLRANSLFTPLVRYAIKTRWERNPNFLTAVFGWAEVLCGENSSPEAERIILNIIVPTNVTDILRKLQEAPIVLQSLIPNIKTRIFNAERNIKNVLRIAVLLCSEGQEERAKEELRKILFETPDMNTVISAVKEVQTLSNFISWLHSERELIEKRSRINDWYGKDQRYIYYIDQYGKQGGKRGEWSMLEGADVNTFKIVSIDGDGSISGIAKDKNFVYVRKRILKGADPNTFERLSSLRLHPYARDKKRIYYGEDFDPLEMADRDSFEILSISYARDCNNIYNDGVPLKVDRNSFELLFGGSLYARDAKQVYGNFHRYEKRILTRIEGIDGNSFHVLSSRYAKDKDNVYRHDFKAKEDGKIIKLNSSEHKREVGRTRSSITNTKWQRQFGEYSETLTKVEGFERTWILLKHYLRSALAKKKS